MRGLRIAVAVLAVALVALVAWVLTRKPETMTVRTATVLVVRTNADGVPGTTK